MRRRGGPEPAVSLRKMLVGRFGEQMVLFVCTVVHADVVESSATVTNGEAIVVVYFWAG